MLVGILTVRGPRGFSGNWRNFKDIIRAGMKRHISVIVVPAEGINFSEKLCEGFKWEGEWTKSTFPLPTVMYNRISTRNAEARSDVRKVKAKLKQAGIPYYNESFFDKGELYSIVEMDPLTNRLLPETLPFDRSSLKEMLDRHGRVYLKPVQSKAGQGIYCLENSSKGLLLLRQVKGKLDIRETTLRKVVLSLANANKYGGYVIQSAITLAKTDSRPYDLRTLLQKNREGQWGVTGIGARVAPKNGIMTHVPNGGMIREPIDVLASTFSDSAPEIMRNVETEAILLANVIEQGLPGIIGEMSIDMGVDSEGNPWFFEANAKPMKFDEPKIRSLSLNRILDFSEFLANS